MITLKYTKSVLLILNKILNKYITLQMRKLPFDMSGNVVTQGANQVPYSHGRINYFCID